jgi:hypothetical protein
VISLPGDASTVAREDSPCRYDLRYRDLSMSERRVGSIPERRCKNDKRQRTPSSTDSPTIEMAYAVRAGGHPSYSSVTGSPEAGTSSSTPRFAVIGPDVADHRSSNVRAITSGPSRAVSTVRAVTLLDATCAAADGAGGAALIGGMRIGPAVG